MWQKGRGQKESQSEHESVHRRWFKVGGDDMRRLAGGLRGLSHPAPGRRSMGTSVRQLQGTEFCPQPEEAQNQMLPENVQISVSAANALILAL